MSKSLHTNRKVLAGSYFDGGVHNNDNASRIFLLDKAFCQFNQGTFDEMTFLEFKKHFPKKLIESDENYFRDLHAQLTNATAAAIQVLS